MQSQSTTSSHEAKLIKFLSKDIGGMGMSNTQIKQFSSDLKELGILDLSKSNTQSWLMTDKIGQASLVTLGTWHSLGLLSKIAEIKTICKDK